MPSTGVVSEVVIAIVLLSLSIAGVRRLRDQIGTLESWRVQVVAVDSYLPSRSPLFATLGGITSGGTGAAMLTRPPGTRYFVAFIAHAASFRGDVALWTGVQQALAPRGDVRLVGYCDHPGCEGDPAAGAKHPPFAVIAYTDYRTARVLLHADADRQALVLDGDLAALGSVGWSERSRPSELATAIARLM